MVNMVLLEKGRDVTTKPQQAGLVSLQWKRGGYVVVMNLNNKSLCLLAEWRPLI